MSAVATLTSPWRGLSPAVWILVMARAVNRIGAFTLPFLGVVLTVEFGASLSQTGLILALFGAATIPSRLLGGHLADRLGRRRTIVLGLTGCAVAQTWIALSHALWSAVFATVLLGLAFEIYEPPSQAMIADVTSPSDRPAAYGLYSAALAAAGSWPACSPQRSATSTCAGSSSPTLSPAWPAPSWSHSPFQLTYGGRRQRSSSGPRKSRCGGTGGCCFCLPAGPCSPPSTCNW